MRKGVLNVKDGILSQLYLSNYTYLVRINGETLCACKEKPIRKKNSLMWTIYEGDCLIQENGLFKEVRVLDKEPISIIKLLKRRGIIDD